MQSTRRITLSDVAGFQVTMIGRFWVITEADGAAARVSIKFSAKPQPEKRRVCECQRKFAKVDRDQDTTVGSRQCRRC